MRLLNTQTLQLEYFATEHKPEYAILSHTWGSEEVLFEDARNGKGSLHECKKSGLEKVLKSAEVAAQNGYQYIWIDTCCIDKSSSAELSEAINSMFAWYQLSAVCYAFLSDYKACDGKLSESRWFTRGWTLQELIAPSEVHFYDLGWTRFGDRRSFSSQIAVITGIDEVLLRRKSSCSFHQVVSGGSKRGCKNCSHEAMALTRRSLNTCSISTRMSWAAHRETARVEDIAYCLLGLFDVAMPLLYGEGLEAFRRLQEEIVRHSNDQTFLAWQHRKREGSRKDAIFAAHPACFSDGQRFRAVPSLLSEFTTTVQNGGVELEIYLAPCTVKPLFGDCQYVWLAVLNCSEVEDDFCCVSILLEETNAAPRSAAPRSFRRLGSAGDHCFPPILVSPSVGVYTTVLKDISAPFQIESELSEMVRSRILLHETKDGWSTSGPIDRRVCFTFPGGLMPGYYVRRQVPDPIAPTWENTGLPRPYPISGRTTPSGGGKGPPPYVYGAAGISDGKCEFSVIWGTFRGTRRKSDWPALNIADDENEAPFCKVCQNLDGMAQEADGLDTTDWLVRVLEMVRLQDERNASPAMVDFQPLGGFSSLTWITDSGSSVWIEAAIKVNEFLGRKRFDIEVTMKEVGFDHKMS
ncbi:heterokaryon incompatibility protein-domain-containing protein [Lasiosphaeria miniovina]|uniref:Heterokaryon incompatibility protein-domain-containing protein n=1 Tax=Lasiosphaeria miniovina TaxID=1954250 RepID=A0AA40ATG3_9PEZI|nr:heterokaryon incompatibility protein-domain-containing protein [Lasiosphaeria miniovina]KAK0721696.1 heterokaryon incompatibility protein-domain-containing protein [Lasiosphaeria miniovina]